jgi:hypothetical protein
MGTGVIDLSYRFAMLVREAAPYIGFSRTSSGCYWPETKKASTSEAF